MAFKDYATDPEQIKPFITNDAYALADVITELTKEINILNGILRSRI